MNVRSCADPMTYSGNVCHQAIDVWTFGNDRTVCDVIAAFRGIELDPSAERFDATCARVRGSPCPGGFGLVWRIAEPDKEWGISMRFRHPLVLLLGGLLSASSVGCSAVTAVVSDTRPAARQGRGSTDKYAAIARVYENQGRYDQAEAMYRRALKQNPNNTEVRSSLQQLASRKAGRKFGNEIKTEAVAASSAAQNAVVEKAVALNAKASALPSQLKTTSESELKTASLAVELLSNESGSQAGKLSPASFEESVAETKAAVSASAEVAATDNTELEVTLQESTATATATATVSQTLSADPLVSAEQILAVVETPGEHAELLLNGLKHGDSLETQCLAATLLGDCDRSNVAIRTALQKANAAATDPYLRLAICDSRIQRAEQDTVTAKCLIGLLNDAPTELQVQACSSLHHFVASESESACVAALESALISDSAELRASAAVALGDFPNLPDSAKVQLEKMANSDSAAPVREAAKASVDRYRPDDSDTAEILVMPRK